MNWKIENEKLTKTFTLNGFTEIIDGLAEIKTIANEMNHHPDFEVYGYKHIKFTLFTHSSNSITVLDNQLAEKIDSVYS